MCLIFLATLLLYHEELLEDEHHGKPTNNHYPIAFRFVRKGN